MHTTAVVVARGGSVRVPGKALRPFGNSTLIGHKVDQLRQCARVDEIVVGSDSDEILEEAVSHGASIRKRDDYHCDESQCSANEMVRNMVAMLATDVVMWAHPTNPLCGADIYDSAIDAYQRGVATGERDSLFSATKAQRHAWDDCRRPLNFDPWGVRHPLASELPPMFMQDGAVFIQPHEQMLRNSYFYGRRPLLLEIDHPYGFDVDTERDLVCARALHDAMREGVAA